MNDEELNQLAEQLWKRMEPFARVELERLFSNYMSTRTLLEPDLVKKLFEAMEKDMTKFVTTQFRQMRESDRSAFQEQKAQFEKWRRRMEDTSGWKKE